MSVKQISNEPSALQVEMLSEKCQEYVNRYRGFAKASAESFIELAKTVKEAEKKLRKSDFAVFCFHVGLERNGSTYRKLIAIAENADRFLPHVLSLPPAWTTLYDLAQLSIGDFGKVVESGIISPNMTAKDVKSVLPPVEGSAKKLTKKKEAEKTLDDLVASGRAKVVPSPAKPVSSGSEAPHQDFTITLDLAGRDPEIQSQVHTEICIMSVQRNFSMRVGAGLLAALKSNDASDQENLNDAESEGEARRSENAQKPAGADRFKDFT